MKKNSSIEKDWWQKTTLYQIYPRSFYDANGDGIGDIRGILKKLDHIKDLGFETIWLSPPYASPQQDFGYDISDYRAIAPEYGTIKDAGELIRQVHKRGLHIIFDMVMNHTSIEHPWFKESRSSRDNPKRDWYIWHDGRGLRPPNNWKSETGGSGWHLDRTTGQYYYASFLPFQPDLNFHNPAVRAEMLDTIRFWLDRGVDGFRLDIFHAVYKDPSFIDNPFSWRYIPSTKSSDCFFQKMIHNLHRPETFELARDMRAIADLYNPPRLLLGEVFGTDEQLKEYLGPRGDRLHLMFLFEMLDFSFSAAFFRRIIEKFERLYPAPLVPTYVFGNHDRRRLMSRIGHDLRKAKLLALLQFTVRGVPVAYNGEEIGMKDADFPAHGGLDPVAQKYRFIPQFLVRAFRLYINRDGCRTPLQWDATPNAGFSGPGTKTWLPVNDDYRTVNVQKQQEDPESLMSAYRGLLKTRKVNPALNSGTLMMIETGDKDVLGYERRKDKNVCRIYINFSEQAKKVSVIKKDKMLFSTNAHCTLDENSLTLIPLSGCITGQGAL